MPRSFPLVLCCALTAAVGGGIASAEELLTSRPLAPRSTSTGTTRFTVLPAETLGVQAQNRYADPAMWGTRYREFSLGAIGTGLAAGDFDGDGWVDLFVVGKTDPSRLFRNLGNWQFTDVTAAAGIAFPADAWTQGASFADIDNDGDLDLYVCRYDAPNLLFVNQGDGTFREEAGPRGLAVTDASGMAALADYDRDGALDLYLQTNALNLEARPNGQPDRLYRNRGDGTFEDVTARAGITGDTQGHSATWWDYNEDGWPDLYVANDFEDPDTLYRNNRDGTFTNVLSWVVPHTPHSSMGADLGDVNNDGHVDLFVADMAATTRKKDHRGMAKIRGGLPEPDPRQSRLAPQYMHNALFLGTGTTRALEAARLAGLAATDWTWAVRFEDLDNDGWLDLHVTNGMVRELHHADTVARMMAREGQAERIRIMRETPRLDEANLAFRNRGDLQFEEVSAAWGLDQVGVSFASVFADFDQDGDLDLVFSNYEAPPTFCRNDSPAGHRLLLDLRGRSSNRFGVGARVELESAAGRQVRELVLSRGYLGNSEPVLHFGLGEQSTVRRLTVRWPSGHVQVFENLAADRRYTITEPAAAPPPVAPPAATVPQFVEIGESANLRLSAPDAAYDEFRRQPLLPLRQNPLGPAAAVGDLDGDGEDDLAVGGTTGHRAQLLSNLGGGQFLAYGGSLFADQSRTPDAGVLLFEANGDGHPDLLATKGGVTRPPGDAAYRVRLFLNTGDGRFESAPEEALPPLTPSAGPATAADFDRDGDLDLMIGGRGIPGSYPLPADSVLLRNDGGVFRDVTASIAPALRAAGIVQGALWSDVDADGWPDLLLAREWAHLLYLRNENGTRLVDASAAAGFAAPGAGFWRSIAAADFNADGRLDYAVGNVGLNTPYQPSPARPELLYRGPLNGRDQIIAAAADPTDGTLYPVVPRDRLAAVFPALIQQFSRHDAYATSPLSQVLGEAWLADAMRFELHEARSGVFLSRADGTYEFQPLPRLAQLAPIYGLWAGDATGDGHPDLVYVGNSHAPVASVGRFDGGLGGLLEGDGRGGFRWVPPAQSGIIVPFDGKALCAIDLDQNGWPDFFVTRHGDTSLAFRNTGRAGRSSFAVRLQGLPGNPTGIGARVTARYADEREVTVEISAGSGYLSQSTAAAFFGYPDERPPRLIRVQWPDGSLSESPWHDTPTLLVRAPAP